MGRLFWKFFLSILLAQVAATLAIGGAFWLRDMSRAETPHSDIDYGPPAEFMVQAGAATLRHSGRAALAEYARTIRHHTLYAVDQSGHDILGHDLSPQARADAERLLTGGDSKAAALVAAPDGQHYLLFAEHERRPPPDLNGMPPPKPGFGPGSPPGMPHGRPFDSEWWHMLPLGVATMASLLFAALLAWYFARPIRALRGAFNAAAGGDLSPRFAHSLVGPSDELNDLGRDFDRMSAELKAMVEGQRRLLHDVSHELRSPLARMQAAIGLAHQQPEKLASCLERIEKEGGRMDKLVGQLLALARLDAGKTLPAFEPVNIGDLLNDLVSDARFEAQQKKQEVRFEDAGDIMVSGAADLLWSALENIVRNAIKHSPEGAPIDVQASSDDERVSIHVLDRGPGVKPEDLCKIFDAFYRSAPAENNIDGHGLGLAIAQRVVKAHGGSIDARNREGGGLEVTITLPRRPA